MFSRILQGIIHLSAGVALFSILATALYYEMPVTTGELLFCAFAATGIMIVILKRSSRFLPSAQDLNAHRSDSSANFAGLKMTVLVFASLISLGVWWYILLTHPILTSVRSPWAVLPPSMVLTLIVPVLSALLLFPTARAVSFLLTVLTLFSALSLAASAYPLGFGFDPFLHRATVEHIAAHGTITPKPLYYIGQYVIELFAVKVFHLPLFLFDVFLVPFLTALLLPALIFVPLKTGSRPTALAPLLFLPFAAFIQTTPQALAFVFTTAVALLLANTRGDEDEGKEPYVLAGIFAVAALAAHPLAGLPAVFFVLLSLLKNHRFLFVTTAILSVVALPLAFALQALRAHLPLGFSIPTAEKLSSLPIAVFLGTHFNAWGDLAYLVIGNFFFLTVFLALLGASHMKRAAMVPLVSAGSAFLTFLILGLFVDFPFLISYEQSAFAARMLTLTSLFLLPLLPNAFPRFQETIDLTKTRHVFSLVMIGVVFAANVYGAYPRHDAYAESAGFNVTPGDIQAVRAMEEYARGQNYVVLANQAVSSAAVKELGFQTYYHGDIFFYPIPTGGPLYELYLSMAESPQMSVIEEAREETGAELVFFVMNDYWWNARRVIEQSKTLTETVWTFENGAVTVMAF